MIIKQYFRKFKKIPAIFAGALLISAFSAVPVTYADGAVDLSIETKEININDIPADRKVPIAVNLDNDPGVEGMNLIISADSRLGIEDRFTWCISSYKVSTSELKSSPHIDLCDIIMKKHDNNSEGLVNLYYSIPADCRPGDFYEIAFYEEEINGVQMCFADSSYEWKFGPDSFGRLTLGGIRITGEVPAPEPPVQNNVPDDNVIQSDPPPASDAQTANLPQNETEESQTNENTEVTSTVLETKAKVTTVASSDTIKNSVTTDKIIITESSESTETVHHEETDHKENNNKSYLVYILIIAGVAVIAVAVIIRNKGKKKS